MKTGPIVYVYGEETFLADRALREVEREVLSPGGAELNREVFEATEAQPASVVSAARTLPFLGTRRLVIVKSAHQWSAEAWQRVLPYLESPNPSSCLVFLADTLDRRTRAGKVLEKVAQLVECRRPAERDLLPWAERMAREANLTLSARLLQTLVLRVGPDLQLLWQEIQKLQAFAGEDRTVAEEDIESLVGVSRGTTVFALCDALGGKDLGQALRTLRRLLDLGEPPPRILFMVVRHFRSLWIARELLDGEARPNPRASAGRLGVPPFAAEGLLRQARNWRPEGLKAAFRSFLAADLSLKTGGGNEVLEGLFLRLCRRVNAARPGGSRGATSGGRGGAGRAR